MKAMKIISAAAKRKVSNVHVLFDPVKLERFIIFKI